MILTWSVTRDEALLISAIVKRALLADKARRIDPLTLNMDITAAHLNGCPLKLQELLEAGELDFAHDVWGISRHINRDTGKLADSFLPRYAKS